MPPAPYLLHVNSRPTQVSDEVWKRWYIDEHLAEFVNSGTSVRATLYEEIDLPGGRGIDNPRRYLALYQTDFEESLLSKNYTVIKSTSELFKQGGSSSDDILENGDIDARNYELIQNYDPNNIGEVAPPFMVTAEMQPRDPVDFDKWYREEHLHMLSKLPGYRRSLRYKLGPRTPLTEGDDPPRFLAIHEVDDAVKALSGKEIEDVNATEWTKKNVSESDAFIARGWRLLHKEGY